MSMKYFTLEPEKNSPTFPNDGQENLNKNQPNKKLSQTRSHTELYQAMQRYEDKRRQRTMLLVIDREKKEINELKKSVHNK